MASDELLWNHAIELGDSSYADELEMRHALGAQVLVEGYQVALNIETGEITCEPVLLPAAAYPTPKAATPPACPYDTPLF